MEVEDSLELALEILEYYVHNNDFNPDSNPFDARRISRLNSGYLITLGACARRFVDGYVEYTRTPWYNRDLPFCLKVLAMLLMSYDEIYTRSLMLSQGMLHVEDLMNCIHNSLHESDMRNDAKTSDRVAYNDNIRGEIGYPNSIHSRRFILVNKIKRCVHNWMFNEHSQCNDEETTHGNYTLHYKGCFSGVLDYNYADQEISDEINAGYLPDRIQNCDVPEATTGIKRRIANSKIMKWFFRKWRKSMSASKLKRQQGILFRKALKKQSMDPSGHKMRNKNSHIRTIKALLFLRGEKNDYRRSPLENPEFSKYHRNVRNLCQETVVSGVQQSSPVVVSGQCLVDDKFEDEGYQSLESKGNNDMLDEHSSNTLEKMTIKTKAKCSGNDIEEDGNQSWKKNSEISLAKMPSLESLNESTNYGNIFRSYQTRTKYTHENPDFISLTRTISSEFVQSQQDSSCPSTDGSLKSSFSLESESGSDSDLREFSIRKKPEFDFKDVHLKSEVRHKTEFPVCDESENSENCDAVKPANNADPDVSNNDESSYHSREKIAFKNIQYEELAGVDTFGLQQLYADKTYHNYSILLFPFLWQYIFEEDENHASKCRYEGSTVFPKRLWNKAEPTKPNFEIHDFCFLPIHPKEKVRLWSINGEHFIGKRQRLNQKDSYNLPLRDKSYYDNRQCGEEKCCRSFWMTLHSNYRRCGSCQLSSDYDIQNENTPDHEAEKLTPKLDFYPAHRDKPKRYNHLSFKFNQTPKFEDDVFETDSEIAEDIILLSNPKEVERTEKYSKIHLGNTKVSFNFHVKDFVAFLQNDSESYSGKEECHSLKLLLRRLILKTKISSTPGKLSKKKKGRIYSQTKRKTLLGLIDKFFLLYDAGFPHKSEDLSVKKLYKQIFDYLPFKHENTFIVYPIHGLKNYFELMSVPVSERPPHGETMRFEWVRVRSFWSFPSNVHVSPVGLARVGFYYTGKVSECKCFCCGAVYKDWKDGDDPYAIHRQISPTCPYLKGMESGNIPIHEEDRMSPRPQVTQTLFASSFIPRGAEGFTGNETLPGIINSELSRIPVSQGGEGSSQSGDFSFNRSASEQTAPSTQEASVSEPGAGFFSRPQVPNAGLPLALSANQQPTASENVPAIDPAGQFALQLPPRTEGPATTQPTLVLRPGQLSSNSGLPSLAPQSIQPRIQFNEGSNANRATSSQSVSSTNQPTTSTRSNLLPPTTTATVASLSTSSNASRTASTANTASTTASTSSSGSTTGYSGPSTEPLTRHSGYTGPSTEPTTARAAAVSDSSRSRFDPLGINFEKPKYPAYAVLTVRMNTYNGWPAYLDQSPRNMSLAGFFYAGYGDYTRCFFCGGGLRNWEAGDDPWVEHARWFPKCAFLRQNQGERFVNVVQQKHQEAEATNQPMVLPRQQSVLDQGHAGSDIMASVCVQTLRDFGKDDRIIKEAIEKWQRSRRSGAPVNSSDLQATEIYEIILQIEDESVRRGLPGQIQQAALPAPSTSQPNNQLVASGEQSEGATADQEQFPELDKVFDEWLTNKMKLTCKICHDKPVAIAFLPCGHLVCCHDCAPAMRKCPSCHHVVKGTIKTFFP